MLESLVYHLKKLAPWVSRQREPTEKCIKYFPTRTHNEDVAGSWSSDDSYTHIKVPMYYRDNPYAKEGEVVTCENDHPICEFVQTVYVGDMQDLENQLGFWHQQPPEIGQHQIPKCAKCGSWFCISGGILHFEDGWRDPFGLIEKYGFPEE